MFQVSCKNFIMLNELKLWINFLEKGEMSSMKQMELKVLSAIISLYVINIVTSLKIPHTTGVLEGCKVGFTLLVV